MGTISESLIKSATLEPLRVNPDEIVMFQMHTKDIWCAISKDSSEISHKISYNALQCELSYNNAPHPYQKGSYFI